MRVQPSKNIGKCLLGLVSLAILVNNVNCLQNIRIQVNNDNLQSPPYLLEAVRQFENSVNGSQLINPVLQVSSSSNKSSLVAGSLAKNEEPSAVISDVPIGDADIDEENSNDATSVPSGGFKLIKEETIEETIDVDPEDGLGTSNESSSIANGTTTTTTQPPVLIGEPVESSRPNHKRITLPVSSSHLKRPFMAMPLDDDREIGEASKPIPVGQVTATVAKDEPELVSGTRDLDIDTRQDHSAWVKPQEAADLTPNSAGIFTREYGQRPRTRITTGGGYVRDKLPPLIDPSSPEYQDDKPTKPIAPLERPTQKPRTSSSSSGSNGSEITRVIEIPERLILPESAIQPAMSLTRTPPIIGPSKQTGRRDSRCPKTGVNTFEHSAACDKYLYCEDGYMVEEVCPNGLMYGTSEPEVDYCIHRWRANCEDKSVPNPISSPGCRWQWGLFMVQSSPRCSPDYYDCKAGSFEVKKCPLEGQVWDDKTKSCRFAELVGCTEEALGDFRCPHDDQDNTYWPFPRYFLSERALIHCINDKPQIVRCPEGERVDPESLHCVPYAKLAASASASSSLTGRNSMKGTQQWSRKKIQPSETSPAPPSTSAKSTN